MNDMDNMKLINDTAGHLAGDQTLSVMGKVLQLACAMALVLLQSSACSNASASAPRTSGGSDAAAGSGGLTSGSGGGDGEGLGGTGGPSMGGASTGGVGATAGSGGSAEASGGSGFGITPSGASAQHARDAYTQFKLDFVVDCGNETTRIANGIGSAETVSEGMGYGMLMVAYLEADATGPQLMRAMLDFVSSKLDANGLMHWRVTCDTVASENAATDADLDYAFALIQAERRWPGQGFGDAARGFLKAILGHETDACGLKPGDVWGGCDGEANPSYAALGYLDVFQCFTGDAAWAAVRDNTMQRQLAYWQANYALPPDWVRVDTGPTSGRYSRGNYGYDATRVAWRLGVDYIWHGKADTKAQLEKIVSVVRSSSPDPATIGDGYDYQSGALISGNHNAAFVGPFAVASIVDMTNQPWLDAIYADLLGLYEGNYYNDALRVLALMALSGSFPKPC